MKRESKILFIIPIYLPAQLTGSEMIVRDLAESLVKMNHKVAIATSDVQSARGWYIPCSNRILFPDHSVINDVRIIRLSCRPIYSLCLFFLNKCTHVISFWKGYCKKLVDRVEILSWGPSFIGLEKTIAEYKPDIVILSPFPAGICLLGRNICKKLHIPYAVIPFFKKDQRLFENTLLSQILDDAAVIFTPTKTEKQYIVGYTKNRHVELLPSSIDLTFIKEHESQIKKATDILKKDFRFMKKKVILFMGNKGKGKGIFDAADACRQLKRPDVVFVTVGNNTRDWDVYRRENPSSIVDIRYQEGVLKYAYYHLADMLILPSVTDNFPIVFLEAWAFKKPVIAYDYYSMKEILKDGSGFLVKPHDRVDLTRTIGKLLLNPEEGIRAGKIGYSKVAQYSREHIAQQHFLPVMKKYFKCDKYFLDYYEK